MGTWSAPVLARSAGPLCLLSSAGGARGAEEGVQPVGEEGAQGEAQQVGEGHQVTHHLGGHDAIGMVWWLIV